VGGERSREKPQNAEFDQRGAERTKRAAANGEDGNVREVLGGVWPSFTAIAGTMDRGGSRVPRGSRAPYHGQPVSGSDQGNNGPATRPTAGLARATREEWRVVQVSQLRRLAAGSRVTPSSDPIVRLRGWGKRTKNAAP